MNWQLILSAIAIVESSNNPKAFNAESGAAGLYQIRLCVLEDVNTWGYHFYPDDRYDMLKAQRIAVIYLSHYSRAFARKYGREPSEKEVCGIWNQGYVGLDKYPDKVDIYWKKIEVALSSLSSKSAKR